mmetsp:Transcript_23599/g.45099  ORF Transcript_23599/g.45099 Transcript_23599/m.45099 type:complete len:211 (-) Transcript_23599:34-666(-)
MAELYEDLYKLILIGDSQVGKTCLLSRYMKGTVPQAAQATIGVEFATRTVQVAGGQTVKVQIWDTAGQERYRAITSAHYRNATGALLVYDVTSEISFQNCAKWLTDLRNGAGPDVLIQLVGNKADLVEAKPELRAVSQDAAEKFASEHGLKFMEASAVTGYNLPEIFVQLIEEVHKQSPQAEQGAKGANISMGGMSPGSVIPGQAGCEKC